VANDRDPVLVTGGAGFIGSHLVRRLVEEGRQVRVLDVPQAPTVHLPLNSFELLRGDIRNPSDVKRAVAGCGQVYHLAANPNLWAPKRSHFHQVNYLGTVNVLSQAHQAGVRRILHTSTESILTRVRQAGPIAEDQQVPSADVIGPYCRSKFRAERFAFRLARAGAPIIIVNPTIPVGPGDYGRSPPTQMMLDFCRGKRSEYLDADLNLIDVRDVALGMIRAMAVGRPGRRYLLGHENLSIREVFNQLARLTGVPEPRRRVPYAVALAAAYAGEFIADVFTRTLPAASITGVKLTRRVMHFDARRSLAELGLQPRPVAQSIADEVEWFRRAGWIR
jgi:dihydroflavonol-4-reductase